MELFPTNIATGSAFCNRHEERSLLKHYILGGRHVVIMAPRRYGKTSLINQVLSEIKIPHALMELTVATTNEDVEKIILKQVSELLYSILPKANKAKTNILKLFSWLNPELTLTVGKQKIVFNRSHSMRKQDSVSSNISDVLKQLDHAAKKTKKRLVIVMDEFQQLSEIGDASIEAALRHAMQYSENISYVFSGSNRHMLEDMFNNKNRPFYNACELIVLERISEIDYINFIQSAAMSKWKKRLPEKIIDHIFILSERHPSYVNRICGYFWLIGKIPTIASINKFWDNFVAAKHSEFTSEIIALSKNQKKLITYLAKEPSKHPSSQAVCNNLGISESSARQALKKLIRIDLLYKADDGFIKILDPALKQFLLQF